MKKKTAKKKMATAKPAESKGSGRVKCRVKVRCELEVLPGRSAIAERGTIVECEKATADLLKDKLDIIGAAPVAQLEN